MLMESAELTYNLASPPPLPHFPVVSLSSKNLEQGGKLGLCAFYWVRTWLLEVCRHS